MGRLRQFFNRIFGKKQKKLPEQQYQVMNNNNFKNDLQKNIIPKDEISFNEVSDYFNQSPKKISKQTVNDVLHNEQHDKYEDKIRIITNEYSKKLQNFDRKTIYNALEFLNKRRQNHGKNNDDIKLNTEAKKVFELMKEYEQSIKKFFVDNNIDITHITSIAPDKLENGVLRKSIDRANNYETERVDGVFASSIPVDGHNPYIARSSSSGMIMLGKSICIYENDNIKVTQDLEGKNHAILKHPNYIYYINPNKFNPVCNLTMDLESNKPIFEFSEEWISDSEIDISDSNQVRSIEQVRDVTNLLENYTILCDTQSQGIGMKARQLKTKADALEFIEMKIKDGSVRNINEEVGINNRNLTSIER